MINHYDVLEIPNCSDVNTIKASFRKKALVLHPDKQTGNAEEFKKIKDSYEFLMIPENKYAYDITLTLTIEDKFVKVIENFMDDDFNEFNSKTRKFLRTCMYMIIYKISENLLNDKDII